MYKFLFSLFFLLAVPFCFASCSDDDEEYLQDRVYIIIQKLRSESYSNVRIYRNSTLVAAGNKSDTFLGFEKPYIIVDGSNVYNSSTGITTPEGTRVYLDLNKLTDLRTWPDPENSDALYLRMYFD